MQFCTIFHFVKYSFLSQAVRQLPYLGGRTNTTAALNLLRRTVFQTSAGDRPSAPNVAVLVANGESTLDGDRVSTEAAACRDAGIVMVVVAADRTMTDSVELKSIVSSPTANNYFTTPSLSALPNLTQSVIPAVLLCPGFELMYIWTFMFYAFVYCYGRIILPGRPSFDAMSQFY